MLVWACHTVVVTPSCLSLLFFLFFNTRASHTVYRLEDPAFHATDWKISAAAVLPMRTGWRTHLSDTNPTEIHFEKLSSAVANAKKLLETLLHCRPLSFPWVCKCRSFALITKQLYMMLFRSILKSVLGNDLRTDGRLWSACLQSPGWLEGRCAALNDLGCFSVWHVVVGYYCFT